MCYCSGHKVEWQAERKCGLLSLSARLGLAPAGVHVLNTQTIICTYNIKQSHFRNPGLTYL